MPEPTAAEPTQPTLAPQFKCPSCGNRLELSTTLVACVCGRTWPLEKGIPRFFQPAQYWGELPQQEASTLLTSARERGWRDAVQTLLSGKPSMQISILDLQRASWLPLLGLDQSAVALDVGSGYGAITHALATVCKQVYSLEAIPERIEFTRLRLAQENITNVCLAQGTALELPFLDHFFDLVVVNGVLEWVGEWDTSKDPRDVQIHFLSQLHRILKDDGVLVIGIENRIGYSAWRGAIDHSGLSYTSLMPRALASMVLRLSRREHHRTTLNPKREYRTYTYSQFGYRRLLREGGFNETSFYWADPGYNQPYAVVPLRNSLMRLYLGTKHYDPTQARRSGWKWRTKLALANIRPLGILASEFLILAQKQSASQQSMSARWWKRLKAALTQLPDLQNPQLLLLTRAHGKKSTILIFEPNKEEAKVILKIAPAGEGGDRAVLSEFDHLALVNSFLQKRRGLPFSAPRPIGCKQVAGFVYAAQSGVEGQQLSRMLFALPPKQRLAYVREQVPRCVEACIALAQMLRGAPEVQPVDPSWWDCVPGWHSSPPLDRLVSGRSTSGTNDWVQHGDFTIENIYVSQSAKEVVLVDWEDLRGGLTPFYDVLSLLLSLLPAIQVDGGTQASRDALWEAQFLTAFFRQGAWAELFKKLLVESCERFGTPSSQLWGGFIQCLNLRANYHRARNSQFARYHIRFLELCGEHSSEFIIPHG